MSTAPLTVLSKPTRVALLSTPMNKTASPLLLQRIALTGASGAIGSRLLRRLTSAGAEVIALVRNAPSSPRQAKWNVDTGEVDTAVLGACDAVIHLAGRSVAQRWSKRVKQEIRDSRVGPTRALCERMAQWEQKPRVLVAASAIGIYGDRGDELCTEATPAGSGFLPDVCTEWEAATQPARDAGIRVVNARIGIVLSAHTGALAQMLRFARLGLAGRVGSGRQWISWIAMSDVVAAIEHLARHDSISGPVNLVTDAVRQIDFIHTLGSVLHRPTVLPLPGFGVKTLFGEMGRDLLLGSTRVEPARLKASDFKGSLPTLESALRHELSQEK